MREVANNNDNSDGAATDDDKIVVDGDTGNLDGISIDIGTDSIVSDGDTKIPSQPRPIPPIIAKEEREIKLAQFTKPIDIFTKGIQRVSFDFNHFNSLKFRDNRNFQTKTGQDKYTEQEI